MVSHCVAREQARLPQMAQPVHAERAASGGRGGQGDKETRRYLNS
ncbi:MAG: hypothetical protein WBF90_13940 [Rivularia sp. (in: cyanobacteria)]